MILAKLINPQIFYVAGVKTSFDNTLVYFDSDSLEEMERMTISLPYAMPDPEIETMVKQMAVDKALTLSIVQEPQAELQWDWPTFDL